MADASLQKLYAGFLRADLAQIGSRMGDERNTFVTPLNVINIVLSLVRKVCRPKVK